MTNAEKYLKEGVDLCELIRNIADYEPKLETSDNVYAKMQEFFYEPTTLTLTEDERIILKNVKSDYKYIGRKSFLGVEFLYVSSKENGEDFTPLTPFDHLFQFINNGQEYPIAELLKE